MDHRGDVFKNASTSLKTTSRTSLGKKNKLLLIHSPSTIQGLILFYIFLFSSCLYAETYLHNCNHSKFSYTSFFIALFFINNLHVAMYFTYLPSFYSHFLCLKELYMSMVQNPRDRELLQRQNISYFPGAITTKYFKIFTSFLIFCTNLHR